tara:strand:+ start:6703 stop:8175 length:1473 start_codon:yes stop_codon:yes gene_type:complete
MMILFHIILVDIINMSEKGVDYSLHKRLGSNDRLLVFYNFSGMSNRHIGNELDDGINYGVIENCEPAIDTGAYSGVVCGFGSSVASAKTFTTDTFLQGNKANLDKSNLKITGAASIPYNDNSIIFDFEFNNKGVDDCVLFGSLEKISTTINSEVITGAKGFNFGVTKRGKLFYQSFDRGGDFIYTADSIELSKRNVISLAIGKASLDISRHDYLNNHITKDSFSLDSSYIAANDEFFLGGADQYFRKGAAGCSGEFGTASGVALNSFCFISGYLPPSALFSIGSGVIGDYFSDAGSNTFKRELTGYNQTYVYKTGITGYDYETTGTLSISTGRPMLTGSFVGAGTSSLEEGDRYFVYRSFDDSLSDSGIKTFVKEEVGYLHPDSGYQYLPTGERAAFDTLGLQNVEKAVQQYSEQTGISGAAEITVKLYGSRFMTGLLSGISGVKQEPVYQTVIDTPALPTSGVRLGGLSELFKKDYVYYLGERITGVKI